MTEIEPTVENVQPGDIVTIERGKPGEPGYTLSVNRVDDATVSTEGIALATVRGRVRGGYYRLTRITRPAPPIPTEPGERFWARYEVAAYAEEFVVTSRYGETLFASLHDGLWWTPEEHSESFTVVPAPEPETVTVPADLIREAEEWNDSLMRSTEIGAGILTRIVQAVREARKEEES